MEIETTMPYDTIYSCKLPQSSFKFSIRRTNEQDRNPQVLRIDTNLEEWVPNHICARHYEFHSPNQDYRAVFVVSEDKDEEHLRIQAIKNATEAIAKINEVAIMY